MNKKYFFVTMLMLVVLMSVIVSSVPKWKDTTCPITTETDIVFYGDTGFGGVGDISRSWIIHYLDWWVSEDPTISYVELTGDDIISNCALSDFSNVKLYIQPGGNAYYQQRSLGPQGKQKILDVIDSGTAYLGICAGFFFAAGDYYWQGDYYDHADLLGIYPTVEGSIVDIADYDSNSPYAVTPVSTGHNMVYYGGPTVGYEYTPSSNLIGEKLASFSAISGELPSAILYNNLLLMSVHAEAYENDGITGLSTEDRIQNYIWLATQLNNVAGTSFSVPVPLNPECGDGIDNDLDGLVDILDGGCDSSLDDDESNCGDFVCEGGETWETCLADCALPVCGDGIDNDLDGLIDFPEDPGCSSLIDEDETDSTGSVELLYDGFEDGILSPWTTSGVGTPWIVSNEDASSGVYSLIAKATGVSENSYVEIDVSYCDTAINFEYDRKLIGLDGVDDFEASYFDGTWNNVEKLGDSNANDASFVQKNFVIPGGVTKVRFMCECGAVSEKCFVDEVRLTCQ